MKAQLLVICLLQSLVSAEIAYNPALRKINYGKVPTWGACLFKTDCTLKVDDCCDAYLAGYPNASLCGPGIRTDNYTIPTTITTYGGYSFKCPDAVYSFDSAYNLQISALALMSIFVMQ